MKQFFKMMFASTLGMLVATGVLVLTGTFVLIGMAASISSRPAYTPPANTVFKLALNGSLADNAEDNPFAVLLGETATQLSLKDILQSIRAAKNEPNIKGIYIESGAFSAGTASIDAVRRALLDFKESGKFVVAYADNYMQGGYYLSSVADKVFLNPQGAVYLLGFASQTTFYKGILKKAGIEMQIFKVGTYKGYVEPFMLDKLSDENREQITSYMNSIWGNICEGIAGARKLSANEVNRFADEGMSLSAAGNAVTYGLVDELGYKIDVDAYVKELAGQTDDKLKTTGVDKLRNVKESIKKKADKIAVLYAEGSIMPQAAASPYNSAPTITERMADELHKLYRDDEVKAVVLRVNSPGGSAFVSDQIWHEVARMKEAKPLVVSMGDVAASGGYYISCAASRIIAERNTVTGSIGIFGMFPNASGLYKMLDVTTDVVKTNHFGDIGSLARPMREDEKALIQSHIEQGYDTFLSRCAEGRGMTREEVDRIGQGRVWTGEQALERGLVDELGGLDRAIEAAAELSGTTDYSVTHVSGSKDFLTGLLEKQLDNLRLSIVKHMLGEEFEQVKKLHDIRSARGILARMPYDIEPL
ncbi:MAG: signal peptide peptidase SppA [Tannerellaceae bacterium]|jgi:protease-4|nr:signal peptide peptidase SppA [Tannerellaceae bacterium]